MSIGIPAHLAPAIFAKALSRLFVVYAATCLIISEILLFIAAGAEHSLNIFWAGLSIGISGGVLWYSLSKAPSRLRATLYLLSTTFSLAWASFAVLTITEHTFNTAFTPLAFMSFAVAMVCGWFTATWERLVWLSLGYASSQFVLLTVSALTGSLFAFDFRVLVGVILAGIAIASTPVLLAKTTKAQASIDESNEVTQVEIFRSEATRGATMAVHDTLLATLSLIGMAKPGPLPDATRRNIESQLASLHTSNWVGNAVRPEIEPNRAELSQALLEVISAAENSGLQVNVSGHAELIDNLGSTEAEALLAALAQCLTNVAKHSGQTAAEVVLLGTDDSVTATVIDNGVGFDKNAVAEDRLGLRLSVIARVEGVGGTVNIWTGNGLGTAIMLKVPLAGGRS